MRIMDATALSGFARKTAESASDFASVVHNLIMDVRDSYRPELHYMRGPGPKWRANVRRRERLTPPDSRSGSESGISISAQHSRERPTCKSPSSP
jgi:hypothetical protein